MTDLIKLWHSATDAFRGIAEWSSLKASWPLIRRNTPDGDGHPVLILPGFLTNDNYTAPLRQCLADKGYKVYTSDSGYNLGLNDKTADTLSARIEQIFAENGGKKISIVGHSLGGVYARELAREYPDMVRCVVTLGSPFGTLAKPNATPKMLQKIYEMFNAGTDHLNNAELMERGMTPPPVPTTSIFSKVDGVVDWVACINPKAPQTENIEVVSSHLGMIVNPWAVCAVLDRLAQPEGNWKKFDHTAYDDSISVLYSLGPDDNDVPRNPGWTPKPDSKPLFRRK